MPHHRSTSTTQARFPIITGIGPFSFLGRVLYIMSVTFSSYGGYEAAGSPSLSGTADERKATRTGYISWSNINSLFIALFPSPVGGIPQLPDLFPGSSVLYAESVKFDPDLGEDDVILTAGPPPTYSLARVTIGYSTRQYDQATTADPIITRRRVASGQMMTLPNTGLAWADGDGGIIENPEVQAAKFVGQITHAITLHRVVTVPWATIRSLVGKVNNATFEGAAAECLLFDSLEEEQVVTQNGTDASNVTLNFIERNVDGNTLVTWNHLYDPGTGTFRRVKRYGSTDAAAGESSSSGAGDTGGDLYVKGNFSLLT